ALPIFQKDCSTVVDLDGLVVEHLVDTAAVVVEHSFGFVPDVDKGHSDYNQKVFVAVKNVALKTECFQLTLLSHKPSYHLALHMSVSVYDHRHQLNYLFSYNSPSFQLVYAKKHN